MRQTWGMPEHAIRFLQVDVFAEYAGAGNPLGVVIGSESWSDAQRQSFAAWTGIVETTYLLPPTLPGASYRLRIFTPRREIPYAGHPSVGSAHAALTLGYAQPVDGLLRQECAAGVLPIRVEHDGVARSLSIEAPRARVLLSGEEARARMTGILRDSILGALPPALLEGGRRWWLAELEGESAVRTYRPDHRAIEDFAHASDTLGLCLFARADAGSPHDLVVRAFPGGVGIHEDPASGAANGLIAAYIASGEPDGPLARGYVVSQGREIGHDARLRIDIDDTGAVWVGGRSHTVIDGTVDWPASPL